MSPGVGGALFGEVDADREVDREGRPDGPRHDLQEGPDVGVRVGVDNLDGVGDQERDGEQEQRDLSAALPAFNAGHAGMLTLHL